MRVWLLLLGILVVVTAAFPQQATPLHLRSVGSQRQLAPRIFGSCIYLFDRNRSDPAKIAALQRMHIAMSRFPGGSDANYYDWRRGLPVIPGGPDSSSYMQWWVKTARNMATANPGGVSFEQIQPLAHGIGADMVLIPNLETSTVAEQQAWLQHLQGLGMVPNHIELGNEFWVAMGGDPAVMQRWPDEPTSMRIMHRYADALRPYFPAGTKVAVQAAARGEFGDANTGAFTRRLQAWDENLHSEPWFDAVTVHLYPRMSQVLGREGAGPTTAANAPRRFHALMAHCDAGVDHVLSFLEQRVPDKELWITEWNPNGSSVVAGTNPVTQAMRLQLTTRMALAYLRHPSVTMSLFFQMNFKDSPRATFVQDGSGGYTPVAFAQALAWLNEAANGEPTYQRVVEDGAAPVPSGGMLSNESYLPVEGAWFQTGGHRTLILQNASPDRRALALDGPPPAHAEAVAEPRLEAGDMHAAVVRTLDPQAVVLPPWSVTRLTW